MHMMRITWFGHLKKMICLGVISVILGLAMLTLVFCLPVDSMRRHVSASADTMLMDASQLSERGWLRYIWEHRESYTDAIMVQNAIEKIEGKSAYEHAMWAYHSDLDANVWTPEPSLDYLAAGGDASVMFLHQYSRYWHGYLVYLKPLLMVLTWEQIVWLGAGLQVLLTLTVLFFSLKRKRPEIGIALLAGMIFMKPVLMLASFAMTVCWVITLAALLIILLGHEKIEQRDAYPELFLMIGISVAYFDFLTYPVVTLGFPLCAYFLIKREETIKTNVVRMIAYSVCWCLGYLGMWGMKWVIADLTLHTGTIKSAAGSILGWTEAIGGRPRFSGGFYVISLNLQQYGSLLYPLAATALVLLCAVVFAYACRKTSLKRALACCVPYVLIACIPFAWYIVVQHHSGLHVAFTFRVASAAGMALGSMILGLLRLGREFEGSFPKGTSGN